MVATVRIHTTLGRASPNGGGGRHRRERYAGLASGDTCWKATLGQHLASQLASDSAKRVVYDVGMVRKATPDSRLGQDLTND